MSGYESLFLKRLGASPLEIGVINSLVSLTAVLVSGPVGWFTDRIRNMKRMYLASSSLGLFNYLGLALAQSPLGFLLINVWRTITERLNAPAKTIIDIDSVSNRTRVTGLSVHRTITAIGGIVGPMIAAYILTYYGGLGSAASFRPLFIYQFVLNAVVFVILWRGLDDVLLRRGEAKLGFLASFSSVFRGSPALQMLFCKDIIQNFFALMSGPYLGIYQVDVKLATAFIIGFMGAGEMLVDVFLSIPIGRVISRFGRRKIAYLGHLVGVVARCILFLTPATHPELLIVYSLLGSVEGCMYLGWDAFAQEVVPQDVRGKYLGVRTVIVGLIGVFAPILGGVLWNLNPDYLWWVNALHWTFVAFPLMIVLMEKHG